MAVTTDQANPSTRYTKSYKNRQIAIKILSNIEYFSLLLYFRGDTFWMTLLRAFETISEGGANIMCGCYGKGGIGSGCRFKFYPGS